MRSLGPFFFLSPSFVLLSLPFPFLDDRNWSSPGVRWSAYPYSFIHCLPYLPLIWLFIYSPSTLFSTVSIRLDKARSRMSGYWKFNSSLLAEDDFRNQLELMIKRELTGAMMGNRWWGNLKDSIRSFAADYSRRLKLDTVAEQRSI